jgi:hypothetical protein
MNQRRIGEEPVIPHAAAKAEAEPSEGNERAPEEVMFDKADEAAALEDLEQELEGLREDLKEADGKDADTKRTRAERLEKLVALRHERRERDKERTPSDGA